MIHELTKVLRILFQRTSIERILMLDETKKIYFDRIKLEYIQDLMMTYHKEFSDTERKLQIQEMDHQMRQSFWEPGVVDGRQGHMLNAFSVLFYCIPEILTYHENKVVCRYQKLLEWNRLSSCIGEELPVAAMRVRLEEIQGTCTMSFSWIPVIGHNNNQLQKILQKGMADNHFHLRGSSPYFYLSWLNLMNNPGRSSALERLDYLEERQRDKDKKSETEIRRQSLRVLVGEAALIRLYLTAKMLETRVNFLDDARAIYEYEEEEFWLRTFQKVEVLLGNPHRLELNLDILQEAVDSMKPVGMADYLLKYAPSKCMAGEEDYRILSGERWFVYRMLLIVRGKHTEFSRREKNLFFAYLRIQNELRAELLQVNEISGFENFQIYQSRKDLFSHLAGENSEMRLARMAAGEVLKNPYIKFLEVRIGPAKTAEENALNISFYDRAIMQCFQNDSSMDAIPQEIRSTDFFEENSVGFSDADLRTRFFYVMHFHKGQDELPQDIISLECRHYKYRRKNKKLAMELMKFREEYPQLARRVAGIDACGQEIGCRPEVFGRIFRTLKNHILPMEQRQGGYMVPQLKITYHVGEDFLDIVDGLRAIDEAVRFLNLDCGDRIGHALALGVDPKRWYDVKRKQITIRIQDLLDNIVWLHHALIRYRIEDMDSLKGWLEERFSRYFTYIYQVGDKPFLDKMMEAGEKQHGSTKFDMNTYYFSWLLRGDQPSLYKSGYFEWQKPIEIWERYGVNTVNLRSDDIRYIPEVSCLYYMYHYDVDVRKRGNEVHTLHIPSHFIQGVILVQKAMREEIVSRGIGIETNPSSNLRISVMEGYGEHPLKTFYNYGLTKNEKQLMECPQMNVSINTDDKGVFCTRLENEYALVACALEETRDENGIGCYKKEFIYEWLDHIREMGVRQVFLR